MSFGFRFMDMLFPVIFVLVFGLILVLFVVVIVRGVAQWNKNNHSPRLTVDATVVAKRANLSGSVHAHDHHATASTSYYVTFEVESGDRMELTMSGSEYGMLVEGDRGKLSFQGTRYLGFERRYD